MDLVFVYTFTAVKKNESNPKMKSIRLFAAHLCLLAICACGNTQPVPQETAQTAETTIETVKEQGTVFYDLTLEQALEKAKSEGKYVFINFHTKTCRPCRKMEKTVFPTAECGEYINQRFIPIMIDGEDNGTGTEIAKKYSIFIYPTYLILSPDCFKEGEVMGAEYDVNNFLDMLKTIIHDK